jgi:hypothetical protein
MISLVPILIAVALISFVIMFVLFAINNAQMSLFLKNNYKSCFDDTYLGMGNVGYRDVIKFIYSDELCNDETVLVLKNKAKRYIKYIKLTCLSLVVLVVLLIYQYLQ